MSETVTVKIHDVLHDAEDFTPSEVEDYILRGMDDAVTEVRIAKGHTNSPIYFEVDARSLNLQTLSRLAFSAVNLFAHRVSGVEPHNAISKRNVRIEA